MTATVLYTVWCNGKNGDLDCGEWITGATAWEARDDARALGWICGRNMNSKDLCPKHLPVVKTHG